MNELERKAKAGAELIDTLIQFMRFLDYAHRGMFLWAAPHHTRAVRPYPEPEQAK